jgi:ABC-type phosphate transport system substrate-binding protein
MKNTVWLLVSLISLSVGVESAAQTTVTFKVIVSSSNPISSMTRSQVSNLFLKKVMRWDNGSKVVPVDLSQKSTVRQSFSQTVHKKSVSSIRGYWQKMLFSGSTTPPVELASSESVVEFVRGNANAIGYVAKGTAVGDGVKILTITD